MARLWHWRLGHPAEEVPVKKLKEVSLHLNEDCYCCDQSKHKTGNFPRSEEHMQILQANPPFWRVYCDAYGGGKEGTTLGSSLGGESYEGAVGGFVFVCPSSGTLQRKLYATTEQFPAILFPVLG